MLVNSLNEKMRHRLLYEFPFLRKVIPSPWVFDHTLRYIVTPVFIVVLAIRFSGRQTIMAHNLVLGLVAAFWFTTVLVSQDVLSAPFGERRQVSLTPATRHGSTMQGWTDACHRRQLQSAGNPRFPFQFRMFQPKMTRIPSRSWWLPLVTIALVWILPRNSLVSIHFYADAFTPFKFVGHEKEQSIFQPVSSDSIFGRSIVMKSNRKLKIDPERTDMDLEPAAPPVAEVVVSWEPKAARSILERSQQREGTKSSNRPFLVGCVGIPGSGKTTSCKILMDLLPNAIVIPMDGYHFSLDKLRRMENPQDMVYRRGAPDTFDPCSLQKDLTRILYGNESTVTIPGFDHAVGDPQPDQHTFIRGKHDIVICEGIYLLHDSEGWEDVKNLLDYSIYIQAEIDTCINRLKERNKCIPGYTHEEIEIRCDVVDRRNAEISQHSQKYADLVVRSVAIDTEETCEAVDP